jgi:hypothetical protein
MSGAKPIFKISIPQPCSENWNEMKVQGSGRFCENCKKTVVDFSQLTDKELCHFFSANKLIPCGRFHNSQLHINLASVEIKKQGWKRFYKPVLALVSFLSLKNAVASPIKKVDVTISPSPFKKTFISTDKITISGTVKDYQGNPLENAEIIIGEQLMGKTDKEGKFQFEFEITDPSKPYTLFISYPDLVTVVRNYHPAMQSTSYDVVLKKPAQDMGFVTMGVPLLAEILPPFEIGFSKEEKNLSSVAKEELERLAQKMRANPESYVKMTGFADSNKEKAILKARQKAISNFLVDQEGISADRIKFKIEPKINGTRDMILGEGFDPNN